jgi:tol-pal system protein YbgF
MKAFQFRDTLSATLLCSVLALFGCGTVQEGSNEEDWTNTPPVSVTARLEYRIDSLTNENRRLRQQLDAATAENQSMSARITELQSRPSEGTSTPRTTTPSTVTTPPTTTRTPVVPGYDGALKRFQKRDFQGAIDQFNALIGTGVSADLLDNCHYWIGESYFGLKKYNDAIQHFETVVGLSGSDKADDAQLMIGNAYAALGKKAEAKEALQKVITMYPSSPLVKRAKAKMNTL